MNGEEHLAHEINAVIIEHWKWYEVVIFGIRKLGDEGFKHPSWNFSRKTSKSKSISSWTLLSSPFVLFAFDDGKR